MFSNIHDNLKSKEEILSIINSDKFKNIFLSNNINNVIIFGSIRNTSFNDESDIDIAVISEKPLDINTELKINLSLEEMLERDVDLIDINDNKVNNVIFSLDNQVYLETAFFFIFSRNISPRRGFRANTGYTQPFFYLRKMLQADFFKSKTLP